MACVFCGRPASSSGVGAATCELCPSNVPYYDAPTIFAEAWERLALNCFFRKAGPIVRWAVQTMMTPEGRRRADNAELDVIKGWGSQR
jgi:hypothetical protein